jgi:hypothetical protein
MVPFNALEVMGQHRREALMSEAENHRLTRSARLRARKGLVGKVSSWAHSIHRPGQGPRRGAADWDLPVAGPERRAV